MASVRISTLPTNYLEDEEPPPPPKKKKPTKAEKAEMRLKAEREFKKLEIRTELKRELELSKKTVERNREDWENMCRDIKLGEMREELLNWQAKTERLMKQKDNRIALIIDDIGTTEEMHKKNYSTQLEIMDFLKESMKAFQDCAKLLYETEATDLLHEFYDEVQAKTGTEDSLKIKCENVMHATNLVIENQMLSDYHIFLDKRDDRVNTEIEKRYRLRNSIVDKMKTLQKQLLAFLDSLKGETLDAHKYERVGILMDRQKNFVIESQKLNDLEVRQNKISNELQRDLVHVSAENQRRVKELRLEHAYFVQMRKNLETEMRKDRNETYEKLKVLTTHTFYVLKKYQKLGKQGELLLSLAANCRKLQTESEKVVPWGDFQEPIPMVQMEEHFQIKALDLKSHVDLTDEELDSQLKLLSKFWRRQALVEAQIVLLQEQKKKLTEENQYYINKIKLMSKVDDVNDLMKTVTIENVLPTFYAPVPRCLKIPLALRHLFTNH